MKLFTFCLLGLTLLSCVSSHRLNFHERNPAQSYSQDDRDELNFTKLLSALEESKAKSVEEALSVLSSRYPSYFNFYTLMYGSFSLHESSFSEPRAIVFGPRGRFVLTFNGGLHMRGGNALEVMQFDEASSTFQFREVAFKTPLKNEYAEMLKESDIEKETELLKYTKANPAKCTSCHGQKARPLWETYFLWPGAYGGDDDVLTSLFYKTEVNRNGNYSSIISEGIKPGASIGRFITLRKGVADRESEEFRKFVARKKDHPRYRFLPDRAIDSAFVRLNAGELAENIDTSHAIESFLKQPENVSADGYDHARPNLALNLLMYELSVKSLIAASSSRPETEKVPFKISWIYACAQSEPNPKWDFINEANNRKDEQADPTIVFANILSAAEKNMIRQRMGSWSAYYRSFVSQELDMEAEKIKRFEDAFGKNSLTVSLDYSKSARSGRDKKYYSELKGRNLNFYEQTASYDEFDNFYIEASSAYIAKGLGIDLTDFTTNLRRVPTYRESGFQFLISEFQKRRLIKASDSIYQSAEVQKSTCLELEKLAL